jgi:hypothetical protein
MPITYHIDPAAGTLFVFGDGVIGQGERLAAIRAWLADRAFRPGLKTLCDFSGALSAPTLPELLEIIALIEANAARIGAKKLAMVTARAMTFGVARQFQALAAAACGALDVHVFTDRAEAIEWLSPPAA